MIWLFDGRTLTNNDVVAMNKKELRAVKREILESANFVLKNETTIKRDEQMSDLRKDEYDRYTEYEYLGTDRNDQLRYLYQAREYINSKAITLKLILNALGERTDDNILLTSLFDGSSDLNRSLNIVKTVLPTLIGNEFMNQFYPDFYNFAFLLNECLRMKETERHDVAILNGLWVINPEEQIQNKEELLKLIPVAEANQKILTFASSLGRSKK